MSSSTTYTLRHVSCQAHQPSGLTLDAVIASNGTELKLSVRESSTRILDKKDDTCTLHGHPLSRLAIERIAISMFKGSAAVAEEEDAEDRTAVHIDFPPMEFFVPLDAFYDGDENCTDVFQHMIHCDESYTLAVSIDFVMKGGDDGDDDDQAALNTHWQLVIGGESHAAFYTDCDDGMAPFEYPLFTITNESLVPKRLVDGKLNYFGYVMAYTFHRYSMDALGDCSHARIMLYSPQDCTVFDCHCKASPDAVESATMWPYVLQFRGRVVPNAMNLAWMTDEDGNVLKNVYKTKYAFPANTLTRRKTLRLDVLLPAEYRSETQDCTNTYNQDLIIGLQYDGCDSTHRTFVRAFFPLNHCPDERSTGLDLEWDRRVERVRAQMRKKADTAKDDTSL